MRLFLCEKPSQGKDIARVLGATKRSDGCIHGEGLIITWGIGHLLEAAPPEAYGDHFKNWTIEALPILPDHWKVEIKPKVSSQYKIVKKLLNEASELVIATDADREGEMIARELIEHCQYRGPIYRLWLSALNDASIRQALSALKPGAETYSMYLSALARSRADWLIGMNFTRLFTLLGRQAGYQGVLSVGRVQTPTLRLVVERDREIANFKAIPYWKLEVQLTANDKSFVAQWKPHSDITDDLERCVSKQHAMSAHGLLATKPKATVSSVEVERVRETAPLPFDLGTLQQVCSKKLGLGVQETLDVAQALYETHKATTYPRTDCGYLPSSMLPEVPSVLDALVKTDPALKETLSSLNLNQRSRAWDDTKITAHHGIIPTLEPANLAVMSEKERAVYVLIRAHYLAQFLPHHEYDRTVANLECQGLTLQAVGKRIAEVGWKTLLPSTAEEADANDKGQAQILPTLYQGSSANVIDSQVKAMQTQPPKPYTEGDLIKAMKTVAKLIKDPRLAQKLKETTGIGTEATRAGIIKGLLDRGYLIKKGKSVKASETAITLIEAVPPAVADPGTTAVWEQALGMIEAGTLTLEDFISKQGVWITRLVEQYGQARLDLKLPEGPECPACKGKMIQRSSKKGLFWSCLHYPNCHGTAPISDRPGRTKPTKKLTTKPISITVKTAAGTRI
ncbi:DNA topoisomerase III [Pseudomonas luteola]|uniref:DNA topoisomerase n=1 Tax=Pseudomonas luteola TaxID=47886 RepID=A0A2X2C3D3_PSELU|nr:MULTISPECIES: DNA topoisomerase III [Pseudomonas]SPZ02537.1 DNA topoisomerase III [Pseudomonas luteola]